MELTTEQNNLINTILNSDKREHFIQGPGGVGKSFTTLSLILRARQRGLSVLTTATSHAARANLVTKNVTEFESQLKNFIPRTIQSVLGVTPGAQNIAARNKDDMTLKTSIKRKVEIKDTADILIIDECSMMGMSMYKRLQYNRSHFKRIVYVGDMNQLPPVLDEVIDWFKVADVHPLTKVLRTDNTNITYLANEFLNNREPNIENLTVNMDHFKNNLDSNKIILAYKNKKVDGYIHENNVSYAEGVPCISHNTIKYGVQDGDDIDILFNGEPFILGRETRYNFDEVKEFAEYMGIAGLYLRNPNNAKWSELFKDVKLFKIENNPHVPFIYLYDGDKTEYKNREWFFAQSFISIRDRLFKQYKLLTPTRAKDISDAATKYFTHSENTELRNAWGIWLSFTQTVLYARPAVSSTVHKFQGLGVNDVYIHKKGMDAKMLYTAITRARKNVYFI
jgi:hypothetical protein